jgi:hypothetical protein
MIVQFIHEHKADCANVAKLYITGNKKQQSYFGLEFPLLHKGMLTSAPFHIIFI